jgi:hypothetical protein
MRNRSRAGSGSPSSPTVWWKAANAASEFFGFEQTRETGGKSAVEIAAAAKAWGQSDITVVTIVQRRSS